MSKSHGDEEQTRSPVLVGIGLAAGGHEPLRIMLEALNDRSVPMTVFVFDLTENGDDEQALACRFADWTELSVVVADEGHTISPGELIVIGGGRSMRFGGGQLLVEGDGQDPLLAPLDRMLGSLAEAAPRCVGVLLSGAGTDGTLGLKALAEAGGVTLVQDPETAAFGAMPGHAIAMGVVDHVLEPASLADEILAFIEHVESLASPAHENGLDDRIANVLGEICDTLREGTGHDFRHYKQSTLIRRIRRRLRVNRATTPEDYLRQLRESPAEVESLFSNLLINVTAFFRDPEAFDVLASRVLSDLLHERRADEPVRIWTAGCSTGEEPYTLAMLIEEHFDTHPGPHPQVQIFATDIDPHAIEVARRGLYPMGIAEQLSAERLERFFVRRGRRFQVRASLRDRVLFSVHNLITDPPFSQLDLISCRNVLIYLGQHLQQKLIGLFHYALKPNGYLFLGPSESLSSHLELFRPLDHRHRISQRKQTPRPASIGAPSWSGQSRGGPRPTSQLPSTSDPQPDLQTIAQHIVLEEFAPEYALVTSEGRLVTLSANASRYLEFTGGPFDNNVFKLVKAGLRYGLRRALRESNEHRRRVDVANQAVQTSEGGRRVTVTVQPMPQLGSDDELYMIVFQEAGPLIGNLSVIDGDDSVRASAAAASESEYLIEQLEGELATTRSDLERAVQELEAANEELKSSNEELISMNEELQAANEELETSKEEIQTAHDALARANADLENLLTSSRVASVFLDGQGLVRSFTPAIKSIYNLITADIGRPLDHVTHRLFEMPPLPDVDTLDTDAQADPDELHSREGRWYLRRVVPYITADGARDGIVVTFFDVTELKRVEQHLRHSREELRIITDSLPVLIARLDNERRYTFANATYERWFGIAPSDLVGKRIEDIVDEATAAVAVPHIDAALRGELVSYDLTTRHRLGSAPPREAHALYMPDVDAHGEVTGLYAIVMDVTAERRAATRLAAEHDIVRILAETSRIDEAIAPTLERLASLTGARVVEFWRCDDSGDQMHLTAAHASPGPDLEAVEGFVDAGRELTFELGTGMIGTAWTAGDLVHIADVTDEAHCVRAEAARRGHLVAARAIPLLADDACHGVLAFVYQDDGDIDDDLEQTLRSIAHGIAQYVRRVEVEAANRRRAEMLETIRTLSLSLVGELDHDTLVESVVEAATRLSGATHGVFLARADGRTLELGGHARDGSTPPSCAELPASVVDPVLRGEDAQRLAQLVDGDARGRFQSLLGVPVVARSGRPIGGLFMTHARAGVFDQEVTWLIEGIAAHAAVALENADLFERLERELEEHRRTETELVRMAAVVSSADDAILTKDLEGTVLSWNRAAEQLYGYSADEIVGQPVTRLFPEDRIEEHHTILAMLRNGEPIEHHDTVRIARDGTRIDVSVTTSPVYDAEGRPIYASTIARDIRARRQDELRRMFLLELQDQLRPLTGVREVVETALDALSDHLDATRCGLHRVTGDMQNAREISFGTNAPTGGGPRFPLVALEGEALETLRRGATLVVEDTGDDARVGGHLRAVGVGACLVVPNVIGDRLDGLLVVEQSEPRAWLPHEVKTVEEVSQLVWPLHERARSEVALRESEARFRVMADSAPVSIWVTGPDSHGNTWVNRRWLEFTGREMNSEAGEGWADRIHPDDAEHLHASFAHAFATRTQFEVEVRFLRHDGVYRWMLNRGVPRFYDDGNFAGFVGLCVDITERRHAEVALRESERLIRAVLDSTAEAIYGLDPNGRCTFANAACARHLGFDSPDELLGRHMHTLIHHHRADGAPYPAEECPIYQGFQRGVPVHVDDESLYRKDGSAFRAEYWSHPLERDGIMLGAVVTFIDITHRLEAADALRQAKDEADAANQAKSEFLANMSHEIRTPMSAILGYADVLRRHLANPDDLACVDTITRNGNYLIEIINDILDLSRIEAGKLRLENERFSPADLVREVIALMSVRAFERDLPLEAEFCGPIPKTIVSDPTRVRQVLVNLLGNAIKFTKHGRVELQVRVIDDAEDANGPLLEFAVRDTGVGMSADIIERLFQPFTQADTSVTREYGGTGLGLTISKRLVEMLGGTIRVASTPGVGSEFTFTVPTGSLDGVEHIAVTRLERQHTDRLPAVRFDLQGAHILVADDRRDVRYLAQGYLEEAGARVIAASDGREALDRIVALHEQGDPVDVAVLDMQMPGLDGYETTRRLRELGFDLTVVALTASAMKGDRERCLAAGCTDYLSKPVERARLLATVARHYHALEDAPRTMPDDAPDDARSEDPMTQSEQRRVLLVEDDIDAAESLGMLLEMSDYEVRMAHTGTDAEATVESWAPDIVLCDLTLPDTTGHELVVKLKAAPNCASTSFLALSGHAQREAIERSLEAGFVQHLVKPVDLDVLLKVLSDLG